MLCVRDVCVCVFVCEVIYVLVSSGVGLASAGCEAGSGHVMSAAQHAGTQVATGLAIFASLLLFMAIAVRGGGLHAELEESQPRNVPAAFAEEAERTRIESATRRAADTLDAARQQEGDLVCVRMRGVEREGLGREGGYPSAYCV